MMLLFLIGAALSANSAQGTERPESHNNNAINCAVLKRSRTVGQNLGSAEPSFLDKSQSGHQPLAPNPRTSKLGPQLR
jgi:hypothetical protein